LAQNEVTVLPHVPYSPDLSPCDIFLFPQLKRAMKDHHYADIQAIKTAVTEQLHSIPESAFQSCFNNLKKCWQWCIDAGGDYFEGEKQQ
jgi:histone-lysine N-methyltransferase SETMAR